MSVIGKIFQAPFWILVIGSYAASFYAAYAGLITSGWYVPVIYSIVLILYLIGVFLDRRQKAQAYEEPKVNVQELKEIEDEYQALEQKRNAQEEALEAEVNEVITDEGSNYQG